MASTPGTPLLPVKSSHRVSDLWRSNIIIVYLAMALLCSFYASANDKTFLSLTDLDGFTVQVTYIELVLESGNNLFDLEPLLWIHALRALVANIFAWVEESIGIGFSFFLILLLFVPVLRLFANLRWGFFVFAIPFAAAILSPRAALSMIAVAYLVAFIIKGNAKLLPVSFLFANLSSGTVLNNIIISVLLGRNYHPRSTALYVYIVSLTISMFISFTDKYEGFAEQRDGYTATAAGATGIWAIISRSTIIVSLQEGDYARFFAYLAFGAVALFLLFVSLRLREYRGYTVILLSAFPSLLVEGLGVVSLVVPVLLLLAGQPLRFRPERSGA